ncbi:MAG: PAS domain S-box protein [Verrucomicrobiales bacterium]|nr:PAS domain S-box protein [Verrucomicrobiales bacterium]
MGETSATPLANPDAYSTLDVTERQLADLSTKETDRRFALLANAAPVLIWTSGTDKLCDFFNDPWLAFTGRSMEQELGNGWTDGVHPEDIDRCLQTYVRHFEARLPFRIEYRLRRHDGVYRWILDHGVPRHLPDGSFAGYIGSCIDVTEQRLAHEKAQASAQSAEQLKSILEELTAQQRTILNSSPLGIGLVRHRRVVWTNPAHQTLLGYGEEESRGLSTKALYAVDGDYEQLGIEVYETLRRGEPFTSQVRLRKKNGEAFWCQITGKAVNPADPDGGSIWLLKDVDEIRRADAQFRLQSEMLVHMGEGVVLVSERDGTILYTNAKFDRMLGYAAGELVGQPVSIVNTPGELSREEMASRIFAELQKNGCWDGDIANQRKDGTSILCHASVSRFRHSEHGDVWMSAHTDITQAKAMERALREAKERYDDLVRHIPSGVQLVRLHPDGTYGFDFVSPRTAQLIGIELDELYKDATLWLRHAWPEDAAKAAEETRRCIASHQPYKWEGRFNVAEQTRWLRFVGHPRAQADGDVLWDAVVTDITEQKALEAAQRESQKMTAIGHLAGGMAHEFNNILAAMLINIGLAQEDDSPASLAETLAELQKSCVRAGGLIKQLLAFSQKSALHSQRIELNEFLARQMPLLQRSVGDRVRVEWVGSKYPLWIMGDLLLLEQVLRNLCENAGEAMQARGLVRLGIEAIDLKPDPSSTPPGTRTGRFACLSVADHGCGMDSRTRGHLFEPFFTTKEVGQGTGLGLATVQGIVHQHRGWIEVESELGRGSCFRVYLPVDEGIDRPSGVRSTEASPLGGSATILVAEDDPTLRRVIFLLLNRAGYRVLAASDAASAQEFWETHGNDIALVLTDVVMPGTESGIQLAQRFMKQRPDLKVILTSGYKTLVNARMEEASDKVVYLAKPVTSEVLLRTVQEALNPVW